MNKNVVLKIVAICAGVFIVFGALAAILAVKLSPAVWEKGYNFEDGNFFAIGSREPFEYHEEKSFELDGITQINIDTVSSDVDISVSASTADVVYDAHGYAAEDAVKLVCEKRGNVLFIKIEYPKFSRGLSIIQGLLQIGIPESYSGSISIDSVSADINTYGQLNNTFDELQVDTVSGDLNFECIELERFGFHSVSGRATFTAKINGEVFVDTISGDVDIKTVNSGNAKVGVDTVSGKVKVGYDVVCNTDIDTISGDVTLDLPSDVKIDLDFDSTSGDLDGDYNKSSEGEYVQVDTVSGDLTIQ